MLWILILFIYYAVSSEQDNLQSNGISIPLENTEKQSNDSMAKSNNIFYLANSLELTNFDLDWLNPGELVIRQDLLSLVF